MLNFLPLPAPRLLAPLPDGLADARNALLRDAEDHTDLTEHMQVIAIIAEARSRVIEIAARCARVQPILDVADALDDAAFPLTCEAHAWDDDREARQHGDRLDQRRMAAE